MTPYLKKRLAREARKLAYRCANGDATELISRQMKDEDDSRCALGTVLYAAIPGVEPYDLYFRLPSKCLCDAAAVIHANDHASGQADRQSRLVFPLLSFADAVEAE